MTETDVIARVAEIVGTAEAMAPEQERRIAGATSGLGAVLRDLMEDE